MEKARSAGNQMGRLVQQSGQCKRMAMKSRMRGILVRAVAFAVSLTFLLFLGTVQFSIYAQTGENPERNNYSDEIRKTYNFLFGKGNLSLPGNAATVGNEFIQPGAFP
jgi:hypothetical protein